jgi:hypothetical protein
MTRIEKAAKKLVKIYLQRVGYGDFEPTIAQSFKKALVDLKGAIFQQEQIKKAREISGGRP